MQYILNFKEDIVIIPYRNVIFIHTSVLWTTSKQNPRQASMQVLVKVVKVYMCQ